MKIFKQVTKDITDIIKKQYKESRNKHESVLLGSSAFVYFKKNDLWDHIISKTGIFKTKDLYYNYFNGLMKKGFIKSIERRTRDHHRQKIYEITEDGIMSLPVDVYTFVQLLVDGSSEEIEHHDELQPPTESQQIQQPKPLSVAEKLEATCDHLKETLIFKNQQYGSSSLEPIGIFPLPRESKIQARLEDKISRLAQISRNEDIDALKDTLLDLAGYSILYLVILEEEK